MSRRLIAHLAHVEALTPNPEEPLAPGGVGMEIDTGGSRV